jgi:transcriptional regulator with XRE-family HTH domain
MESSRVVKDPVRIGTRPEHSGVSATYRQGMDPLSDGGEIRRRLRAARALAIPTENESGSRGEPGISQGELAARLEPEGRGYGKDTISLWERGERVPSTTQLKAIAAACELPFEFFLVDLQLLKALRNEVVHIQPIAEGGENVPANRAVVVGHLAERLEAIEGELGLRDAARSDHQALVQALDAADEAESSAASDTREPSDASPAAAPAPARETRSS